MPVLLQKPTFREAFRFWLKLGFISFGGPTGQISVMYTELVEKKKWISDDRFLHALNYCMILPGPEAQQLAIYIGWLLHRTKGGIAAGLLFVLPSALLLWLLSSVYIIWGHLSYIAAIFDGLKSAVLAIILLAVIRIGRRTLTNELMWSVAGLAFVAIFFLKLPFPVIIFSAGVVGFIGNKFFPSQFHLLKTRGSPQNQAASEEEISIHTEPSLKRAVRILLTCLFLWVTPLFLVWLFLGPHHVLFQEGVFFSKAALVTFGGAYSVLPYVSQQAVEHYHWLAPGQMLDGLGLAETTPGPLIIVLQFVGFLGGWKAPAPFVPWVAAALGSAITTWVTFLPCFLWVFLGAPYVEKLRGNIKITAVLSCITAAVVGVVLNLALWFGRNVLFPVGHAPNWWGACVAITACYGMYRWKWGMIPVIGMAGLLGLVHWFVIS